MKLLLIDGHSILNRAFYGVPDLTNSKGLHTNAVYGFLNIMFRVLDDEKADHLAVAFDLKDPTFRHKMYAEYKGTRKPMPEELHEQVPVIKEVLTAMNIPILTKSGFEADDILGTVAKRSQAAGMDVTILSGDRDLLQLADERIQICLPKTVKGTTEVHRYFPADVLREYQVTPQEFIDLKALMGDSSDNIPGVPSIGEKTATAIITAWHSIENAYAHVEEIKPPRAQKALAEHYDMAQMSKTLATICIDADIDFNPADSAVGNIYTQEAYQLLTGLEFKSILQRFDIDGMEMPKAEDHFRRVTDFAEAEDLFMRAKEAKTAGLALQHDGNKVISLSLCTDGENTFILPAGGFLTGEYLAAKAAEILSENPMVQVLDLKDLLPFASSSVKDGDRNAEGRCALRDLGVAAYLLNPLKDTYGYDDIARDYLGMTVPSRADLLGKANWETAWETEESKALRCAGFMAYVAYAAGDILWNKLQETGMDMLFREVEMPVVYSLFHMEEEGIAVERESLREYGEKLAVRVDELEKEIYGETGKTFNINSPKQLGEILFDEMHMPGGKKTKTGYSTAAGVLEKLAVDYPFVQKILDYRQVTKLKSTYADGLADYIGPDGRIHGTFNQTITATGRISSTEPNLQNIPVRMELGREIRKLFVPRKGYLFTDADYSQIELRVLASMSGDENLIEAYREAEDIHAITASKVFGVPLSQVTPELRRNAKAVNFGIVYGISAFGLSDNLSISRKEAADYINSYFESYPQVKQFLDALVASAKETGYSVTAFGRRRPIPELKAANFMQRQFGERVAMNAPIQGTAADIIKIAMIRVDRRLRKEGFKSRLVLQIHDELLVETAPEEQEKVAVLLEEEMKHAADLKVELEIGMKTGKTWFETK
ncbi:MAG: DNA polymerase I [Clostridium sp.]|nr:DNA polymerase I [Clostridium sp.]